MINRRQAGLVVAAFAGFSVACLGSTEVTSVPYGFLTLVAQEAGSRYTATPIGTFYSASGLGVPTATAPWDSCRAQSWSSAPGVSLGSVYPSLNAGASIQIRLSGRTDSLVPMLNRNEMQYRKSNSGSIPYTPGDSVSVVIPGASGELGFPAISFRAKTAEPFTVQDFGVPVVGRRIDVRWNAAQDQNSTMVFSFRYSGIGADTLNAQILCQFRDDGADSIPTRYITSWAGANRRSWVASRVRTWVAPVARGGYFDFISTFDIPTPLAP